MNKSEEQPINAECNLIENNSNENVVDTACDGSSIGKFADADELFKAYVNLEKEFTKKCQRLKELEVAKDNEAVAPAQVDNASKSPEAINEPVLNGQLSIKDMLAMPKRTGANDTSSQNDKNEITDDIKQAILSDSDIRNKFIENYLNEIQSQNIAPLMVKSTSSNFCVMPKQKPENIKAAGEVAKDILNN